MNNENPTPRITMKTILNYILSIFNLERGLGYTLWQLTIRPGDAIQEFLFTETRKKHIKPLSILILFVSISTFLTIKLFPEIGNIDEKIASAPKHLPAFTKDWISFSFKYFNIIQMLKIPFLSLGTFYLFKKRNFNFAEHLVLNCYVFSYVTFFLVFILLLAQIFGSQILPIILILNFIYPCFVYYKLFNETVILTFIKYFSIFWVASILHAVFVLAASLIFL